MKLRFVLLAVVLLMLVLGHSVDQSISKDVGANLLGGVKVEEYDNHGGLLDDGVRWVVMEFQTDISDRLAGKDGWKELPLTGILESIIRTNIHDGFPEDFAVEEGYYYFRDNYSESTDPTDDSALFDRHSYNFVLAIYDSQTHTLYYNETDT